ncbi:hypothetical protein BASA50_005294 [Batrachochytrium salamandrivorans]|uniref:Uncharacterized protein n=1 Tax=Batrachochytrium salamandrivorans TaxID=1357716 RepID=A0ABQ8FG44_9FUNG|nr:hypothetical protein BASA50_005294 [Batrachochytrium salamandrivorans]KAH9272126.1 hypothetical protein BASA83_005717 [Batrachochytrium salamandrivorans]KAJ1330372.1 hypothetical protein BSLG_009506 [Batrachochytrium salamandrivorans]
MREEPFLGAALFGSTTVPPYQTGSGEQPQDLESVDAIRFYDRILESSDRKLASLNILGSKAKSEAYSHLVRCVRQSAWYHKMQCQLTLPPIMLGDSLSTSLNFSKDFWDSADALLNASTSTASVSAVNTDAELSASTNSMLESLASSCRSISAQFSFDNHSPFLAQPCTKSSANALFSGTSAEDLSRFTSSVFGAFSMMPAELNFAMSSSNSGVFLPATDEFQMQFPQSTLLSDPDKSMASNDIKHVTMAHELPALPTSTTSADVETSLEVSSSFIFDSYSSSPPPMQQMLQLSASALSGMLSKSAAGSGNRFIDITLPLPGVGGLSSTTFLSSLTEGISLPAPPQEPAEGVMLEIPHMNLVEHHANISQESSLSRPLSPESYHPRRGSPLKDASGDPEFKLPSPVILPDTPLRAISSTTLAGKLDWPALDEMDISTSDSMVLTSSASPVKMELSLDTPLESSSGARMKGSSPAFVTPRTFVLASPISDRAGSLSEIGDKSTMTEDTELRDSSRSASESLFPRLADIDNRMYIDAPQAAVRRFFSRTPDNERFFESDTFLIEHVPLSLSLSLPTLPSNLLGKRRFDCDRPSSCASEPSQATYDSLANHIKFSCELVSNGRSSSAQGHPLTIITACSSTLQMEQPSNSCRENAMILSKSSTLEDRQAITLDCSDFSSTVSAAPLSSPGFSLSNSGTTTSSSGTRVHSFAVVAGQPSFCQEFVAKITDAYELASLPITNTCTTASCVQCVLSPTQRTQDELKDATNKESYQHPTQQLTLTASPSTATSSFIASFFDADEQGGAAILSSDVDNRENFISDLSNSNVIDPLPMISKPHLVNRDISSKRMRSGSSYPSPPDPN